MISRNQLLALSKHSHFSFTTILKHSFLDRIVALDTVPYVDTYKEQIRIKVIY